MSSESLDPADAEAAVGLALIVAGLALTPVAVALARRLHPGRRVFFARWGFSHLLFVGLAFFVALVVVGLVSSQVGGITSGFGMLLGNALVFSGAVAACVAVARRMEPQPARALGLDRSGIVRGAVTGVACYLSLLPLFFGLLLAWPFVLELLGEVPEPQPVLEIVLALEGLPLIGALLLAIVVMPLLEELVFRGFLQPLFVQNLREKGGVILTSLLFAALHPFEGFAVIFGLSLLLGALMLRTQRLWAPWAAHAAHNGLVLAVLFLVPGAREHLT